jgi:hypothetical protein
MLHVSVLSKQHGSQQSKMEISHDGRDEQSKLMKSIYPNQHQQQKGI